MSSKKSKLGNPAVVAAVVQKAGNSEAAKQATSTIPFAIKTAIVVTIFAVGYRIISTRFKKKSEVSNFPAANITLGQAKSRAASIYKAAGYVYSDFDTIKSQFTIGNGTPVNYNGMVRIYNAFGQVGNIVTGYSDMDAFLNSRLSADHLLQLRFLTSGNWFKNSNNAPNETTDVVEPKLTPENTNQQLKFIGV